MVELRNNRKAKIVATLGPSSSSVEIIKQLILSGMNIARLNMSHGDYENHRRIVKNLREASKMVGQEVAILQDLQGPKIRVASLKQPLQLEKGSQWYIGVPEIAQKYLNKFIPSEYSDLVKDCKPGSRILFDDGKIKANAIKKEGEAFLIEINVL